MSRADVRRSLLTLIVAAAVIPVAAQPVPQARLDVLVSDARGRPIDNLGPSDFNVLVNGTPFPVDEARLMIADGSLPPGEVAEPIATPAGEREQAARENTRLFGILLDEYHVAPGEPTLRGREALTRFVQEYLGPRDLIVLVKPLDSLINLRMTRDREAVLAAIAAFEGRKGLLEPREGFERSFFAGSPERIAAMRAQVAVSALNALAVHMGGLAAGRKSIIVVSEGLVRPERRRTDAYLPTLETVIRSANRANVSLYPFDPGGSATGDERQALETIARETAGVATFTPAAFDQAFQRLARDASAFYLLTIPGLTDGRFHEVNVQVTRPGVQVRSRAAVWAPSAAEAMRRAAARAVAAAPPPAPRRSSPLIRPWFGQRRGPDGKTHVSFVWEPAPRAAGVSGRAAAMPARITFKALASDGSVLFEGVSRPAAVSLPVSGAESSRLGFDVPPGKLRIEMSIEDVQLQRVDTDVREVNITDFKDKVALGTFEVLRGRTARDFRALEADADAAPTAARDFSRAERLLIRVPAYAPDGGPPMVTAQLSSRLGSQMRPLTVSAPDAGNIHQIDLPLAGLAIGEYRVDITAGSDGMTARDSIAFRIVP